MKRYIIVETGLVSCIVYDNLLFKQFVVPTSQATKFANEEMTAHQKEVWLWGGNGKPNKRKK